MSYDKEDMQDALIGDTLKEVIDSLTERGYNPTNQLVGYLMSGDPGYISSNRDARAKITKFDRAKVLETLLKEYMK